jgi:hypothetical protein
LRDRILAGRQHVPLVREVPKERAFRQTSALGDLRDGRRVVSAFVE